MVSTSPKRDQPQRHRQLKKFNIAATFLFVNMFRRVCIYYIFLNSLDFSCIPPLAAIFVGLCTVAKLYQVESVVTRCTCPPYLFSWAVVLLLPLSSFSLTGLIASPVAMAPMTGLWRMVQVPVPVADSSYQRLILFGPIRKILPAEISSKSWLVRQLTRCTARTKTTSIFTPGNHKQGKQMKLFSCVCVFW